jgi:hypothetical protein
MDIENARLQCCAFHHERIKEKEAIQLKIYLMGTSSLICLGEDAIWSVYVNEAYLVD